MLNKENHHININLRYALKRETPIFKCRQMSHLEIHAHFYEVRIKENITYLDQRKTYI